MSTNSIIIGTKEISGSSKCYVIAEIGHNHQGKLETAIKLIEEAALCGVDAVKFQKRHNKNLYTTAFYNKPYENENSYGVTYGEHREYLEFGENEYRKLKQCAEKNNVDFLCTAFDVESVDFLEKIDIPAYKIASGDITNIPLLTYVAKLGKPIIASTGASTMEEVKLAYETVLQYNKQLCLLHCIAEYPADYSNLNLNIIRTFTENFPEAIVGYSGHDNGILAPVIAYMLGARIIEKHFTLCHAWKGTDHKFSLEPAGMKKMVRDLERINVSLGSGEKRINNYELDARTKMGKSLYIAESLPRGTVLERKHVSIKTPGTGLPPYKMADIIGKTLKTDIEKESLILPEHIV